MALASHEAWRSLFGMVHNVLETDACFTASVANDILVQLNAVLGVPVLVSNAHFGENDNVSAEAICTSVLFGAFAFAITNDYDIQIFEDMLKSGCIPRLRSRYALSFLETPAEIKSPGFIRVMREAGSSAMELVVTKHGATALRLQCGHVVALEERLHFLVYPCPLCE